MIERRLAGWVARDLEAHLDELVTAARVWRDGAGERVVVTLHLVSGQRHVGMVIDRARDAVALQSLPQRGTSDLDVTVIPIGRIEALTLHAAQALVPTGPAVGDVAQTSLELKRRARALADLLASRVGTAIAVEVGAGEVGLVAPLFELVRVTLDGVCADELGRQSLATRVRSVEVRAAVVPSLVLEQGTLIVEGAFGAERLRRELDALL